MYFNWSAAVRLTASNAEWCRKCLSIALVHCTIISFRFAISAAQRRPLRLDKSIKRFKFEPMNWSLNRFWPDKHLSTLKAKQWLIFCFQSYIQQVLNFRTRLSKEAITYYLYSKKLHGQCCRANSYCFLVSGLYFGILMIWTVSKFSSFKFVSNSSLSISWTGPIRILDWSPSLLIRFKNWYGTPKW